MTGEPASRSHDTFGPFEIYERLGTGGMAVVHRAVRQLEDGNRQEVALKRLLPHLAEDAAFIRAFAREARTAQRLRHDNICRIHELGRVGDSYFISMELLEGSDLRALLRRAYLRGSPPPLEAALSLLDQLCAALDHAHNATDADSGEPLGLVHRDVSPANVLVTRDGTVKVIDFGIAKATLAKFQTETGRFRGKLGYLSPEAIQGHLVDGRSDLFSVGVIGYELLTAKPLFGAVSDFETLSRVQFNSVEPPSNLNPLVPRALDQAIMSALAKNPGDRWASAAAMREALSEIAPGPSKELLADWAGMARREAPRLGPLGRALAGASASELVIDLMWGGGEKSQPSPPVVPEVPDVSAPLPPRDAIPPATADQSTVQMWALEPRPRGKRGTNPRSVPLSSLLPGPGFVIPKPPELPPDEEAPAEPEERRRESIELEQLQRDTIAMPRLERFDGDPPPPDMGETVKMEQLLRDPANFETVEIEKLEQITSASETIKVAPLVRGSWGSTRAEPEYTIPTEQIPARRGRPLPWRQRWDQIQMMVAALLLLVSPLGREDPAEASAAGAPAGAVMADTPSPVLEVSAAPAALRCHLAVKSRPKNALVWIDDRVIGETPLTTEVDCAGGLLAIEKQRYKTLIRTLSFDGTDEVALDVSLIRRRDERKRSH